MLSDFRKLVVEISIRLQRKSHQTAGLEARQFSMRGKICRGGPLRPPPPPPPPPVQLGLRPMYSFGKWWKWKFSLMGFVYRVVSRVLKTVWIFLSETIKFLENCIKLTFSGCPRKFYHRVNMYIAPSRAVADPGGGGGGRIGRGPPPPPPFFGRFVFLADFFISGAASKNLDSRPPPPFSQILDPPLL